MFPSLSSSNLLDLVKCDIAIVSEHNLKPNNASYMYLDLIHSDYNIYTVYEYIYTLFTLAFLVTV